jgi:hypothetical protein
LKRGIARKIPIVASVSRDRGIAEKILIGFATRGIGFKKCGIALKIGFGISRVGDRLQRRCPVARCK